MKHGPLNVKSDLSVFQFEEWLYGGKYDTYEAEEKGIKYFDG
jgi:hypothetical protein